MGGGRETPTSSIPRPFVGLRWAEWKYSFGTPKRYWNLATSPSPGLHRWTGSDVSDIRHGRCTALIHILICNFLTCDPRCHGVHVVRNRGRPFFPITRYLCSGQNLITFIRESTASETNSCIGSVLIRVFIGTGITIFIPPRPQQARHGRSWNRIWDGVQA
jgi:hypothetical protein